MRWSFLPFVLFLIPALLFAEEESDDGTPEPSDPPAIVSTITVGGMATGVSSYALAEYGWYRGRLGYVGELYSEFAFRNRDDGSSDRYLYAGGSVGIRGSALPGGRGIFGELSVGGGNAWLTTVDGSGARRDSGHNLGVIPRAGIRFGNERGIYGEAAFRVLFSFVEIYLTTEADEPAGSRDQEISYHAWYLPNVRPISRIYLAVGYTF